jgi:hypothetical protein
VAAIPDRRGSERAVLAIAARDWEHERLITEVNEWNVHDVC